MRWINAAVVDLDAGHGNESVFAFGDLCARFLGEIQQDSLPMPTLICSSGRGMWALWLLRDSEHRIRAYADKIAKAKRIGQAIARRFAHLGADLKCHDCARIMRFPGSRNSNAAPGSDVVRFYRLSDAEYRLDDLGAMFGVAPHKTAVKPTKGPKRTEKQAGGFARWARVLQGFRQLAALRGGFREGTRRSAVYLLAFLMRVNRHDHESIMRECLKLAAACNPPVAAEEVAKRVLAARKVTARLRHDTFIRMLAISPGEVAKLPVWFKPHRASVSKRIQNRRDALADAIQKAGRVFSVRESILVLRAKGFHVSRGTVAVDLRNLIRRRGGASVAGEAFPAPLKGKCPIFDAGRISPLPLVPARTVGHPESEVSA
jgi:hypothetical protein